MLVQFTNAGDEKKKAGRKPKAEGEGFDAKIDFKTTAPTKDAFMKKAQKQKVNPSDFLRKKVEDFLNE
jgi:hypothetical protein